MTSVTVFDEMLGKVFTKVDGEEFVYDGGKFLFYHAQDCCEYVRIEQVDGDLNDLVGSPLLVAEEVTDDLFEDPIKSGSDYTWTFYKFATVKGSVTVRWLGESNGYYSESVSMKHVKG